MNKPILKKDIEEFAKDLGFNKIGIAKVEKLDLEIKHLKNWISQGYNANMNFFNTIEKRYDVRNILPDAKSVIMLAINYFTDSYINSYELNKPYGIISNYTLGEDYHRIILQKLSNLQNKIEEICPESKNVVYVDTGHIMEKQWAIRAGIGWQGKNGLIITKEFGSWVFLGTLITTLDIKPDSPIENKCGNCNLCIDNCPNNAIVEPCVIDARRCIAYLTIEEKSIENKKKNCADYKNIIFGCDICQRICPYNKNPKETDEIAFKSRLESNYINLNEVLEMSNSVFKRKFKGMAIERVTLKRLKDNATLLIHS